MDSFEVSRARLTLGSDCPPERRAALERIVSAAGAVILGFTEAGEAVDDTCGDLRFWEKCKALTPAGERIRDGLLAIERADPLAQARELGIDVEAVKEAAAAMHPPRDFMECLRAELEFRRQASSAFERPAVRGL
jgi:hypothetical protein